MIMHVDYEQILENIPLVSMRLSYEDGEWRTWYVSKSVERYGFAQKEFMDGSVSWKDMLHPDDRVLAERLAGDYMNKQLDDFRLQYRIQTRNRESIWITEYSHINRDAGGNVVCVDSCLINSTEATLSKEMLKDHVRQQVVLNDILLSLHDADLELALQIILDRCGAYLNCSRALLFKDSPDHKTCKVVYEWLNRGIPSVKDLDYAVTYATEMPEIYVALRKTGMLLVNAGEIPENCREEFEKEGLVSSAIFAVYLHGDHYGFVCFDDCVINRVWDEDTANFLKSVTNLISTVLMRMHSEEQLRKSQLTCETVLDNIDSYIFASHPETDEIVFANRAFRTIFGADCIGKKAEDYISLLNAEKQASGRNGTRLHVLDAYEAYLGRTEQWLSITRELVPWVDGRTVYLVNCNDITAKKRYEDNIKRQAYMDHLTGLPNRYRCDIDLANSLESSRRTGQPGYLMFIDLDDFKIVNDCYGHDYGDGVLISFARYLRELYNGDNHVFRFGGDEFVIIVNHGNGAKIQSFLDAMMNRVSKPWKSLDREFYCSLSVGVVEFPACGDAPKSLIKKADIAMYQAKKSGKNSFAFYTEGLDSDSLQRSEMEALLRRAMRHDLQGFEVYYQTYSNTITNRIVGAEALVRMHGDNGDILQAEQFIALAEYLGLAAPLGEFVLARAAEQCRIINTTHGLEDFSLTVNLSAKQFRQKDIVPRLERILAASGVNLANIIVAVNESVAISELDRMLQLCGELRRKGIKIALDDFGSGSASFINMRNLPVDLVKVSPKYIDEIDDQFTGYFLKLVTDLAHFTGKIVCMNGVETEEQLSFCRKFGIDQVQGFLLHRPENVEALKSSLGTGLTRVFRRGFPV